MPDSFSGHFICNELPIIHADKNFQSSFLCGLKCSLADCLKLLSEQANKPRNTKLLIWNGSLLFVCLLLKKIYSSFIFCQEWSKPEVTWNKWHSSELGVLWFLQQWCSTVLLYVRINQYDDHVFQDTAVTLSWAENQRKNWKSKDQKFRNLTDGFVPFLISVLYLGWYRLTVSLL